MSQRRELTRKASNSAVARPLFLSILFVLLSSAAIGQSTDLSPSSGTTPTGLSPGAPAGSYELSGFENVNLYNGNLNFNLPLLHLGGRGSAGYTMTLSINNKGWQVSRHNTSQQGVQYLFSPKANGWAGLDVGLTPGALQGRQTGVPDINFSPCPQSHFYSAYRYSLTRLTFTAPGGTEYDLRDQFTNGQPETEAGGCNAPSAQGFARGTVFTTSDGTTATFVSDSTIYDTKSSQGTTDGATYIYPSGYLLMGDGTRYRIDDGRVTWIRDRNGNRVDFNNTTNVYTDSLGRQVTISYGSGTPPYDTVISFSGTGGTGRTIRLSYNSLRDALRSDYSLQTYSQLFPELNGASSASQYNPTVLTAITLPDNRTYSLKYNSYGELARVVLPTGGAIEYDMTSGSGVLWGYDADGNDTAQVYRRVYERRVYPDGSTLEGKTVYGAFGSGTNSPLDPLNVVPSVGGTNVNVSSYTPAGTLLARQTHYFYGRAEGTLFQAFNWKLYSDWHEGKEYATETLDSNGTTVLRREVNVWQQRAAVSWVASQPQFGSPSNDPRTVETDTTLADTNQITKRTFGYSNDLHNNRTDVWEYDYGAGAAPAYPTRHTHTDYLVVNSSNGVNYADPANGTSYTSSDIHIRNLPRAQQIYSVNPQSGAESPTPVAQSETRYDEYGLTTYGPVTGWTDPGTAARGLATTSRSWLDTSNTWLESHATYDQVGNVVSATDARGITSTVSYADTFADGSRGTYAFPTSTTSAVPDPTGQRGASTPLTSSTVYDYYTGHVTSTTDANGKTTTAQYEAGAYKLDRLTQVNRPDGGRTTYTYVDQHQCGPYVETRTLLDASGRETDAFQFFDGLGRGVRSFSNDPQDSSNPWMTVDTQYDALGRVSRVSNPYRSAGCTSALNPSGRWTTSGYDALGRVKTVTTPDGAVVTTDYGGNQVRVTDQSGKSRLSASDALGRLTDVWELTVSDQWTQTVSFGGQSLTGYHTVYKYDALGNLRRVDQGAQQRYFMYDSLGRVIRAKNPEQAAGSAASNITDPVTGNSQWSAAYGYDADGNLTARVDARDIWTYYTYDNLNRNTLVDYSNTATNPDIDQHYDNPTAGSNGRGRYYYALYNKDDGTIDHQAVDAYDVTGRPLTRRQVFYTNGQWYQYPVTRIYNLAGNVTSQTYPSGHSVSYNYDAAGRLADNAGSAAFYGSLGDGSQRTYAAGVRYDEASRLQTEQLGTQPPLYHKLHYNVRGQLYDVRLSSVAWQTNGAGEWDWNRGAIGNYYSQNDINAQTNAARFNSGPENNGNLLRSEHWVPTDPNASYDGVSTAGSTVATRSDYSYDSLNRLAWMTESPFTSSTGFTQYDIAQTNNYDVYGNRTLDVDSVCGGSQTLGTRAFIESLYQTVLNRGADFGGLQYYQAILRPAYAQGQAQLLASAKSTVAGFFNSQEYLNRNRSDEDYVRDLYHAYLNREPDQDGWNYYMTVLPVYGRAAIRDNFANSTEFSNRVATLCPSGMTFGAGSPKGFVPDAATNRLSVPAGQAGAMAYDPAGNLYVDTYSGQAAQRTYDAENRMTMEQSSVTSIFNRYTYDADGHRVKRDVNGQATWQVYGFDGELLAEYAGGAMPAAPQKEYGYRNGELLVTAEAGGSVNWLVSDHLGTPRMVVDQTGSLSGLKRHDYLPFGEEVGAGVGGRTAGHGYVSDNTRQRYTSKERDAETNLDYFNARYYSSVQGRFTSPDPLLESDEQSQPQSWNRYTYSINNPLKYTDPDGLRYVQRTLENGKIQYGWCDTDECYDNAIDKEAKGYAGWSPVTFDESKPFSYWTTPGIGGDLYSSYTLNPDGTRGFTRILNGGSAGLTTDWGAQFAIGGLLEGAMSAAGAGIDAAAGALSRQAATTAASQAAGTWPAPGAGRAIINGIEYTEHALIRMAPRGLIQKGTEMVSRGVPPSVVENAIQHGVKSVGNQPGTLVFTFENVRVITNAAANRVITVITTGR
jgi:RHS repeat-associated protein